MPNPEDVKLRRLRDTEYRDWRSRGAVSVVETGAIFDYSPDMIRTLIATGKLDTVKTGRNHRVTVKSIKDLLGED